VTVKKYHDDGYAVPIIVRTYEPYDQFTIKVKYLWNGDQEQYDPMRVRSLALANYESYYSLPKGTATLL